MMLIALAAAAAQLSAPYPKNIRDWFSYEDVPSYLIEQGHGRWQVSVRLDVAPNGRMRGCTIESTSRDPRLDELTCAIIHKRGRFEPARYDRGVTFGVYRTSVNWAVGGAAFQPSESGNPDLDLEVQALPAAIKGPALVRVMFAVDADGTTSSCVAEPGQSLERVNNNPLLVQAACQQLGQNYKAVPVRDEAGNTVRSVQDAVVRFAPQRR
jgi:hypothetical protein